MRLARSEPISLAPRGTVLVTPPWNFPLAIAAGGILAGLMAGCRVLFKPALETPLVGELLARLLWSAGIPRTALQLVVCDDEVASSLVTDRRVESVILTGATATARLFQRLRPGLRLLAETGGKNAYVVSVMSDRELAIRDAVQSALPWWTWPRAASRRSPAYRSAALDELNSVCGIHIADEPVLPLGRFELLHYLTEQSVSIEYHRYGNLGAHALGTRRG